MNDKKAPASRKTIYKKLLLFIGMTLLLSSGYLSIVRYRASHKVPSPPNPTQTISSDTDQPDETKPDDIVKAKYKVPADQPRSIRIASANISGLIQRVGLTKDSAIAVPSNIHFAGWYVDSVAPGSPGLSIINGHVSGKYNDAVFKQLARVNVSDTVEVEFGDGQVKKFLVIETKTLPVGQAASYLTTPKIDVSNQLNLVTCGGKFNHAKQIFEDRIIVTTKLLNN